MNKFKTKERALSLGESKLAVNRHAKALCLMLFVLAAALLTSCNMPSQTNNKTDTDEIAEIDSMELAAKEAALEIARRDSMERAAKEAALEIERSDSIELANPVTDPKVIRKTKQELLALAKQVYKWKKNYRAERIADGEEYFYWRDFPYKYELPGDTIVIGIDWDIYNKNIEALQKADLFTDGFLSRYQTIATNLDTSIKKADIKYRSHWGGYLIWDLSAGMWDNSNDGIGCFPDCIQLDSLTLGKSIAKFSWFWKWDDSDYSSRRHYYKMAARKVEEKWKIDWMEGFDEYGDVEYYDQMMKE